MAPTHGKTPQNPPPLFEQKTGPHLPDLHSPDLSTSPGPRCRVRRAGVPSASLRWLAPVRWTSNLGEKGVRDGGGKRQVSPPTVDWWGRTMRPGSMIIYNQFGQRYGVVTIIHLSLARSGAQICTVSHDVCVCVHPWTKGFPPPPLTGRGTVYPTEATVQRRGFCGGTDISSGRGTDVPAFNTMTPLVHPAAVLCFHGSSCYCPSNTGSSATCSRREFSQRATAVT